MVNLHSHVACRMRTGESVGNDVFQLVEWSSGVGFRIEGNVDASVSEFVQGIDCHLNVSEIIPQGEFSVCGKRRRVES